MQFCWNEATPVCRFAYGCLYTTAATVSSCGTDPMTHWECAKIFAINALKKFTNPTPKTQIPTAPQPSSTCIYIYMHSHLTFPLLLNILFPTVQYSKIWGRMSDFSSNRTVGSRTLNTVHVLDASFASHLQGGVATSIPAAMSQVPPVLHLHQHQGGSLRATSAN